LLGIEHMSIPKFSFSYTFETENQIEFHASSGGTNMPKTQSKIHFDNDIPLRPVIIRHIPLGPHINVTGKEWYHINTLYPFKVLQLYIYIYIYFCSYKGFLLHQN
jgi:hypothetical protein